MVTDHKRSLTFCMTLVLYDNNHNLSYSEQFYVYIWQI